MNERGGSAGAMNGFQGFCANDFGNIAGTDWRARDAFGGWLAMELKALSGQPFKSWGVTRRPEIHLADPDNYSFGYPHQTAKLFIYTQNVTGKRPELAYGLYLERPEAGRPTEANFHDWRAFVDEVTGSESTRSLLLQVMREHNLEASAYYSRDDTYGALEERFAFRDGHFVALTAGSDAATPAEPGDFIGRLRQLREGMHDQWTDLHVFRSMAWQEAVARGAYIADDILAVLVDLVPLYRRVIEHDPATFAGTEMSDQEARVVAATDEVLPAYEGAQRKAYILHRQREGRLRRQKIEQVLSTTGRLCCEVPGCGFDFAEVYGEMGAGYAQVHHLTPLSSRESASLTRLEDLAVVCANCHVMIHRGGQCRRLSSLRPKRR